MDPPGKWTRSGEGISREIWINRFGCDETRWHIKRRGSSFHLPGIKDSHLLFRLGGAADDLQPFSISSYLDSILPLPVEENALA